MIDDPYTELHSHMKLSVGIVACPLPLGRSHHWFFEEPVVGATLVPRPQIQGIPWIWGIPLNTAKYRSNTGLE